MIYTEGQNQCQKINNGLLPALFWLTNIKHRIKLVIMHIIENFVSNFSENQAIEY